MSKEEDITQRKPMNAFERSVQVVAFAVAGLGVACMVVYVVLLWSLGYGTLTHVDTEVSGTVGDFIGGVAGSLFALSATLLFYLALTLQRREFQNSLQELRISSQALKASEEHQRDSLQVMREEKEFNVCLTAITDLKDEWNGSRGTGQGDLRHSWLTRYGEAYFFRPEGGQSDYLIGTKRDHMGLPAFASVSGYVDRALWSAQAIHDKTLSAEDRRYLGVVFDPVLKTFEDKVSLAVDDVLRSFNTLLTQQQKQLEGWRVDPSLMTKDVEMHLTPLKTKIEKARGLLNQILASEGQKA